jgi:hypothetical protein
MTIIPATQEAQRISSLRPAWAKLTKQNKKARGIDQVTEHFLSMQETLGSITIMEGEKKKAKNFYNYLTKLLKYSSLPTTNLHETGSSLELQQHMVTI